MIQSPSTAITEAVCDEAETEEGPPAEWREAEEVSEDYGMYALFPLWEKPINRLGTVRAALQDMGLEQAFACGDGGDHSQWDA